jgi:putative FmdB family regulatory protein
MPIYEYECEDHGRFEVLFQHGPLLDFSSCPTCHGVSPFVYSLPVMRPDALWAGMVHPNYGYHTSATSLKQEMARRNHVPVGDRTDREAWDKIADDAQKDKKEKLRKDVRKWSEKTFGPSGLGLGGADGEKLIRETK